MIQSSFSFIPGIGNKTEKMLWGRGIFTWDELGKRINRIRIGKDTRAKIEDYLKRGTRALRQYDGSFFANNLPSKDYWRIYKEFSQKTIFLDIETTGLSLYYDIITLIGTFDGNEIQYFIKDNNLEEFPDYLRNHEVIVTFNGKLFDIPFINKQFPNIKIPPIHIDLRYLLRSVGVMGPLKKIESQLGILRPSELNEINGREAVVLWNRFINGDDQSLEKLLSYNSYDTVNLRTILHYCYRLKANEIRTRMKAATYQMELGEEPIEIKEHSVIEHPHFNIPKIKIKHTGNRLLDLYLDGKKSLSIERDSIHRIEVKLVLILRRIKSRGCSPISLGIDLTGSEQRASGVCLLKEHRAYLDLLKTDEEIITRVHEVEPSIISIDSPLSLPRGRCCPYDYCECRKQGITRECERILRSRGINVYPCLIPSMQNLTIRGIKLAELLREHGYEVIESYPGAAQDILGLPRKKVDLRALEIDLMNMGIKPISKRKIITHDEIDALTSALVGYFYQAGQFESLGNPDEGYLIIPSIDNK